MGQKVRLPCACCGRMKVCTLFGRVGEERLGLCGECLAHEHDKGWLAAHYPWWAEERRFS